MSELSQVNPEDALRALERLGFRSIRQSEGHIALRHPDGRWTTALLPHTEKHLDFHHPDGRWTSAELRKDRILSKGMLRKVLEDLGISSEQFMKVAY
jgi:predicted RNA binding protein YcfA (HicA-like mRNA interferase family)